jgi:hypothetical protein
LTLTVSPMLYQMLRTKFSSIQGSSSPILRAVSDHVLAPMPFRRRRTISRAVMRQQQVGNSPEGGLAGAGLAVAAGAAWRAHVALGREAVARGVHLLAEIGLRAGLVGLLAGGLALELVVVLETHDCSRLAW